MFLDTHLLRTNKREALEGGVPVKSEINLLFFFSLNYVLVLWDIG
jgi:hypothetical protein